jgi:hypothetical protein
MSCEAYTALLETMTRLVCAPEAPGALADDAVGFFLAAGVAGDDAAALASYGDHRLLVYRRHIRRTLAQAVRLEIPRTAACFGEAFVPWVDRWIDEEAPRSRYFRDVAFEFVAWAAPRWVEDESVPVFLGDLARHELVWFEVAASPERAPSEEEPEAQDIALDRSVGFDASVRLVRYQHAVHRLPEVLTASDIPAREPTALLVYRDADDDVRFLELTPLAAGILERLIGGEALGSAVQAACAAIGSPLDGSVTASTAALLSDLLERGALLHSLRSSLRGGAHAS